MVMERDDGKGSGKPMSGHHVGVGGREFPTQIGKGAAMQQKPGDATKNRASFMSWTGGENKK